MVSYQHSIADEIRNKCNCSCSEALESLLAFAKSKSKNETPLFRITRQESVRYPHFGLDILLDGTDSRHRDDNIESFFDNPWDDPFIKNGVLLGDESARSQNLMVIQKDSENEYKTHLRLHSSDVTYSTRVRLREGGLADLQGDYTLCYNIDLGRKGVGIGSELRSVLSADTQTQIYEMRDNRDNHNEELLGAGRF